MLVVILDRAMDIREYDEVIVWVDQCYDDLERMDQDAIEEDVTLFQSYLMKLCVTLLYRLSAAEKYRFGSQ